MGKRLKQRSNHLIFQFIEKILLKLLKKTPNNITALWFLSIWYVTFERYSEAQDLLEVLIRIRPKPYEIKFLSRVYFKREQYNKVVEILSNPGILLDKDSENYYLGYSLFYFRDFYGAIKYLSKYVKYYPKDYAFSYLGYSYWMEQMYDLSLEAYREADKLNTANKEIKHNINLCIEMINERHLNGDPSPGPATQVH